MHGLVNRAIECFLWDTYGPEAWEGIAAEAELGFSSFEAMLIYDREVTERVILAAEARIGKSRDALLEDLGTYLVSNPRYEALRRLMRFAGETFEDFLMTVDELPERARIALPDLEVPVLRIGGVGGNEVEVCCAPGMPGFGLVLAGAVRAMADDYGALVTLSVREAEEDGACCIHVTLHEANHSAGRSFELARSR